MSKKLTALISVIITTKNEEATIKKLILSIRKQSYKNYEIILVDNNSLDETSTIARKMGIRVYNYGPERSAQRNYGSKLSKGKHFLFLDADMELTKNVISECIKSVRNDPKIGAVVILEESKAESFWEKVKAFERSFYNLREDKITYAARFFPKKVFKQIQGYDETLTGPEDWDLTDDIVHMGYKIGIVKSPIYHHEKISSVFTLARKKFYYGLRSYKYLSKQRLPIISPKTVYFLRPVFYKNWKKIVKHPVLSLGLFIMLFIEQIGGGLGYMLGRIKKL